MQEKEDLERLQNSVLIMGEECRTQYLSAFLIMLNAFL